MAISVAASTMTLSLAACGVLDGSGDSAQESPGKGDDITVGLLLPEKANQRYEKFDRPIIKKKVDELTDGKGEVAYANADQNAGRQSRQLQKMIDDKVDVVLLDAVDAHSIASGVKKAKDAGIPVIAYDRLAEGPIDAYVSFDNELVGEVQGKALAEALDGGSGSDKVVMMNGAVTDPNAAQFKQAAQRELGNKVQIAKSYDTKEWKPSNARANMMAAISSLGVENIAGVYSANDGMAGGIVSALKAAGVAEMPPITGQDAELEAVQRIVSGDQYMSVYKPYPEEAEAAAELAVARVRGHGIEFDALTRDKVDSPTTENIPSHLVSVSRLTKDTIEDTVIDDGIYKISDICTAKYESACAEIGLK
ncbi:sugar ABC transporter substrate-binding protein [Streptomyces montanus]|uniref:Sugar ABC transporter substrate-binding protein n=1 Tax=Streptomyces montanus TaxID=2580423 RepID=A0A5R9FKC0_9ACTN|nr:substrate-binding domain-containing protein [Streptomyces montanus]TLS40005.1 sugar ABC transporter substrate-binding protein [Streptomyces montanus]